MLEFVKIFSFLEFQRISYEKNCDQLDWGKLELWKWALDVVRIHQSIVAYPIDRLSIHHNIYQHSNLYEYECNHFAVEQVQLKQE